MRKIVWVCALESRKGRRTKESLTHLGHCEKILSVKRIQGVRDGEPHFAVIEVDMLSMEDGGSVGDSELEYIPCRTVQAVSKTAPYKLLPVATTD